MLALLIASFALSGDPVDKPKSTPDAFRPLATLVGEWKGSGTTDDKAKTLWSEKLEWVWAFKEKDAWLALNVTDGKHITAGELRYDLEKAEFRLKLIAPDKSELTFVGQLRTGKQKEAILELDRTDGDTEQRLTVTLLHPNRFLYQLGTKPKGTTGYTRQYLVGVTKQGEPFADAPTGPECIVSGGRGTIAVSHKGTTYYVCCTGCRDEFKADPEKYIKLVAEKKK